MAAAPELFGDLRHVGTPRPEAHLHAATLLLHEQHPDLGADDAEIVDEVLAVLGNGAGGLIVTATDFGEGDASAVRQLDALQDEAPQSQSG